ncbi:nuclear transport factor 2 family protein [Sphingomonas bisphenolicum]
MPDNVPDLAPDAGVVLTNEAIKARLACEDLVMTSIKLIDDGFAEQARPLFTNDAVHTANGTVFQGEGVTQMFAARQARGGVTRHCVTNLVFRQTSDTTATIWSICVVYGLSQDDESKRKIPHAVIDFTDSFERQSDGRWMITRREATAAE